MAQPAVAEPLDPAGHPDRPTTSPPSPRIGAAILAVSTLYSSNSSAQPLARTAASSSASRAGSTIVLVVYASSVRGRAAPLVSNASTRLAECAGVRRERRTDV